MSIPASNTLTLFFTATTGSLILTMESEGTAFRIDLSSGLTIPAPVSLSGLALTADTLSLHFTAAFSGQVAVAFTAGAGAYLMVAGSFTPGSVQAAWAGQIGAYETLGTGAKLSIN